MDLCACESEEHEHGVGVGVNASLLSGTLVNKSLRGEITPVFNFDNTASVRTFVPENPMNPTETSYF